MTNQHRSLLDLRINDPLIMIISYSFSALTAARSEASLFSMSYSSLDVYIYSYNKFGLYKDIAVYITEISVSL